MGFVIAPKHSRTENSENAHPSAIENPPGTAQGAPSHSPSRSGGVKKRPRGSRGRSRAVAAARERAARSVYVSRLPVDATEGELAAYFGRVAVLDVDGEGRPCVVLYRDAGGGLKGDGKVTFAKEGGAENAVMVLGGSPVRESDGKGGGGIRVERVQFDEGKVRGKAAGGNRGKGRGGAVRAVAKEALGWGEDEDVGGSSKGADGVLRMVVLQPMFDPEKGDCDYEDLEEDLKDGCGQCGAIEKLTIFKGNVDGVVVVKFRNGVGAKKCIEVMHGRWFDQRRVTAGWWDGITDYRVKEDEARKAEREKEFGDWLVGSDEENINGEDAVLTALMEQKAAGHV